MSKDSGIYLVTCRATQWHYVGKTEYSIRARWREHRTLLDKGEHHNRGLQADWALFGAEPFEVTTLEPIAFFVDPSFYKIIGDRESDWIARRIAPLTLAPMLPCSGSSAIAAPALHLTTMVPDLPFRIAIACGVDVRYQIW